MARFFVIYSSQMEVIGCCFTKREALREASEEEGSSIMQIECPINKETVRKILVGSDYATDIKWLKQTDS